MAIESGSPGGSAPAQTSETAGISVDGPEQKRSQAPVSRRGWIQSSLWPWPPVAVTAIALAGFLFGWLGAVVVAGQTVATLLFVAGDTLLEHGKRAWLAVSAVVAGTVVILALLWQIHAIGSLRSRSFAQTNRPTDLVGRTVTQAMLKGLNLRGAILPGAKLDNLSLTSKNLNGVVAPGSSFIESNLQGVPMRGAELPGANFSGACLRNADLTGAQLSGADITGADITGIDLPPSIMKTLVGRPARRGTHVPSCQRRAG